MRFITSAEDKRKAVLFVSILVYTIVLSIATINKHRGFYSYAWDLGVFDQVVHNSLFENRFLQYTCDSYLNLKSSYLAFHFSPILVLLFPFYYLLPNVSTLLILKSLLLALGAFPLYYLGARITGNRNLGLIVSLVYLVQPGLHASNWFDFQPQVFIPLLLFSTYLFFIESRWKLFFPTMILSLLIEEHVFLIYLTLLMGYYLAQREQIKDLIDVNNVRTRCVFVSVFIAFIIFFLGGYTKNIFPVNDLYLDVFQTSKSFEVLEFSGSGFSLPFYVLRNPIKSISALVYDLDLKFLYIIFLYAPLIFLPILNSFSIPSYVLYLPFLLSNYRAYYTLGAHYYLYLVTSIFIGLVYALRGWGDEKRIPKHFVLVSVLFMVILSPLSPLSQAINSDQDVLWYPVQARTDIEIDHLTELVNLVPGDAAVLTMNHLFPHFSGRTNSYVIPVVSVTDEVTVDNLESYIDKLIEASDYVLLDLNVLDFWSEYVFDKIYDGSDFHVWQVKGNAVLFSRSGVSTLLPGETVRVYGVDQLQTGNNPVIYDGSFESPYVVSYKSSRPKNVVYGPYTFLPRGNYLVTFRIRVENSSSPLVGYVQVTRDLEEVLSRKYVWSFDVSSDEWFNVELVLGLEDIAKMTEFQFYSFGDSVTYLQQIRVEPLTYDKIVSSTNSITYEELSIACGNVTDDGYIHSTGKSEHCLWYGPYQVVEPGIYNVEFNLRVHVLSDDHSQNILSLDVVSSKRLEVYAEYNLTEHNVVLDEWNKVVLVIQVDEPTKLEFRGMNSSSGWMIELSEITLNPVLEELIIK